jgi:hypothetical protein
MALPKLNENVKYEVIVPSTQQAVKFRPFLVKEQKVLLMALESQDQKIILNSIVDTIDACVIDPLKTSTLTTFDVEYMFTQIRSKSVGESVEVNLICQECEHQTPTSIKLEDIKIDVPKAKNQIKLNEQYTLNLKYPMYSSTIDHVIEDGSNTEQMYKLIVSCLDSLETPDERISFSDETPEDVESFIENLNSVQFEGIMEFVQNLPQLKHDVDFVCEACKKENKITLQGMQDFFV